MPPRGRKATASTGEKSSAAAKATATKATTSKASRANKVTRATDAPKRADPYASIRDEESPSEGNNDANGRARGARRGTGKSKAKKSDKSTADAQLQEAIGAEEAELVNGNGSDESKSSVKRKRHVEHTDDDEPEDVPRAKRVKKATTSRAQPKQAPKASRAKATKVAKTTTAKKPRAPRGKAKAEEVQDDEVAEDEEPETAPPAPKSRATKPAAKPAAKPRVAAQPAAARPAARTRGLGAKGVAFNNIPTKPFDVFVFGEGSSGELGLGSKKFEGKKPIDVKRPRINHNLKGVVDIACGGMHCIALTNEQAVFTWGVNDDRALGRDTYWEGGTRDVDDDSDSDDDSDDTGVNPNESTPGRVDLSILPEGTKISQVAATDSASFILTDDGWVYGWGTFRGSDGIIGFSDGVRTQATPTIIPGLKNISRLACGSNHVLALDLSGKVFTWGSGGQFQLGRKPLSRLGGPSAGLSPQPCGKFTKKHRAIQVGAGSYHSFYIDESDQVWAWGLNNYAQTGLNDNTGEDDAMVLHPQLVTSLEDQKVSQIVGGEHHSVACTADGKLLTWGRVDGHQVGQPSSIYNEDNALFDGNGKPRILLTPTPIDGIKTTYVAAGTDTSFAIDEAGKVYSWGFSANYQTGQGTIDDIEVPTVIDNTAIRDRKIIWAGAGGQYSMVAAAANEELPNGQ
ncbi:regulator of chromosome condensation 1/beta-lactamase-inhibitor protein II [Annulohypoxylon moriforme]|nr:regulator of chromosome condensation 1/beta-lactamase-inhibitor protein II [Annulohypoxylon moriforme]